MKTKNEILMRRRWAIEVEVSGNEMLPLDFVATAIRNLEALGFVLDPSLVDALRYMTEDDFLSWYEDTQAFLCKMTGKKITAPMYPNFPKQVMDAEAIDLWLTAMVHYFGDVVGVRWMPGFVKEDRDALDPIEGNLKVIRLASEGEFAAIAKAILASKSSLSEQDKADVRFIIEAFGDDIHTLLPVAFSHKENLVLIACEILRASRTTDFLRSWFKTATDVLRMAVAMSDGDISLASVTKFRSFKRSERRFLLNLLEHISAPEEDMLRFELRWVRLGERIHPGEYAKKYPKACEAFDVIRNRPGTIQTFNRSIEKALRFGTTAQILELLEERPGEFARRLDAVLRKSDSPSLVIAGFERVVDKVSTNVLLQLVAHFKQRSDDVLSRVFFPKGNVGKMFSRPDDRAGISSEFCQKVVQISETSLVNRFAKLPSLGKVYIAPELDAYSVPMSQRSASKALKTIARGSRVALSKSQSDADLNTVRFFLWWKEGPGSGRIDVDLSAVLFSEDWTFRKQISYTNLRDRDIKAAHSGDITSAPNGACEYIDVDLPSAQIHNCRYLVMNVYSYSSQSFVDMPECFAGWMMRGNVQGGEVFEPSTVQQRFDLASDSKIAIPVVFDIKTREAIWCDLALSRNVNSQNNLEANGLGVAHLAYAMANHRIPNLGHLFGLHAKGRGERVATKEEADTIFSLTEGVTPDQTEVIMSEYQ